MYNTHQSIQYEKIFENMSDPCVIFEIRDGEPIILKPNKHFKTTFCIDRISPIGRSLNEIIVPDSKQKKAKELDKNTVENKPNETIVERETTKGVKKFLYRGIPLQKNRGFGIYIDISEDIQQQEYISVLSRILRHNIRNQLTVLLGHADIIADSVSNPELQSSAQTIQESTTRLQQLIEEADTIRDIIKTDKPQLQKVQVKSLVYTAVDEALSNIENGEVEVNCSEDLSALAGAKLTLAIKSLVDNGLRHNHSTQPKVSINCSKTARNKVSIIVSDNGTGLPKQAVNILEDTDKITKTNHEEGLGLWMIKWIVKNYNGSIDIMKRNSSGSKIKLTLQTRDQTYNYKRGSNVFKK